MNLNQTTATIVESSPRAADWQKIFGRLNDIPLQGPLPTFANLPGEPNMPIYLLDLSAITLDERSRMIDHIVTRFNLLRADVERDLDAQGMPILVDDIIVSIPHGLALSMMPDDDEDEDEDEF